MKSTKTHGTTLSSADELEYRNLNWLLLQQTVKPLKHEEVAHLADVCEQTTIFVSSMGLYQIWETVNNPNLLFKLLLWTESKRMEKCLKLDGSTTTLGIIVVPSKLVGMIQLISVTLAPNSKPNGTGSSANQRVALGRRPINQTGWCVLCRCSIGVK